MALQADAGRRDAPGRDRGGRGRCTRSTTTSSGSPTTTRTRACWRRASRSCPACSIDPAPVETNIVIFEVADAVAAVRQRSGSDGVQLAPLDARRLRAVTHLDVDRAGRRAGARGMSSAAASRGSGWIERAAHELRGDEQHQARRSRSRARAPGRCSRPPRPPARRAARAARSRARRAAARCRSRAGARSPTTATGMIASSEVASACELALVEEDHERRHEQDPAADAHQAADGAAGEADQRSPRARSLRPAGRSRRPPAAPANSSDTRPARRGAAEATVPSSTPADRRERRPAGPCRRRRCRRRRGRSTPNTAITTIAASDVPVASCSP